MSAPKLRLVDERKAEGRAVEDALLGKPAPSGKQGAPGKPDAAPSVEPEPGARNAGKVPSVGRQTAPPGQRELVSNGRSAAGRSASGRSASGRGASGIPARAGSKPKKRAALARDVMRAPAVCCRASDSLNTAAQLMWEHDLGAIVVVDEQQVPVGLITDRDICMAAYTQGVVLWGSSVTSAMAHRVATCCADASVAELRQQMMDFQVRRIPITDAEGRLVGVVGFSDLLEETQSELPKARKRASSGPELMKLFIRVHSQPDRPRVRAAGA